MGFLSGLGRLIQGKPVFEAGQPSQAGVNGAPAPMPSGGASPSPAAGPKVYPQVYIERVECRTIGGNMDCDVVIQNYSQGQIELDRIELFGKAQQLDIFLRAGEEREFRVYNGVRPTATNQSSCKVYYKDATGDYFYSEHHIEFRQEADGTYTVNRIRFLRVVDV